ncbi:MAG: phosphatidylserine decarboxylase [Bryobacteraceae bacterium]|jgi:phosphatidylserine decarboxylase
MVIDGIYYALAFSAGGALVCYVAGVPFGVPLFLAAAFCLYFFRDPEREIPAGDVAVSPADGRVVALKPEGPQTTRVSIFMNVFDVHVNRAPIAGKIVKVVHKPGRFLIADRERASIENEQNLVEIEGEAATVAFKQIAGLIARRIVCYKRPGDVVAQGERVGLIKFGSRVDVLLGPEWTIEVREGMRVKAGSSVLARRRAE